jgi:dTDP-4-dehydrorhamnose 3,5-epimerase
MKVIHTDIDGVLILEPRVFGDARGFFFESFNQQAFDDAVGQSVTFVQDNHSRSAKGVLRGLHFQREPYAQGKLVRVTSGSVFDVAVDIRPASPTFGRWVGVHLSGENHQQLWVPVGFAHGFLILSESAEVLYKTAGYWNRDCERSLRWNDPAIGIEWPSTGIAPLLADKDGAAPGLAEALAAGDVFGGPLP